MKLPGICKFCGDKTCSFKINRCRKCYLKSKGVKKSSEEMKLYKAEYFQNNRDKIIDRHRKNPPTKEKIKQYSLKYLYGNTLDYNTMLEQQNYSCLICNRKHNENNKKLYVDHNHKTNHIRGLLCFKCNIALGHFNDDIELLKKALNYMEKYDN